MSGNETIADIIAEIRKRMEQLLNAIHSAPLCYPTDSMISQYEILYEFADRLEAALKREKATAENSSAVGDRAKLREVVKKVLDAVKHLSRTHNDDLPEDVRAILGGIAFDANTALAAPPRNCDVGTAKEQIERWEKFCMEHHEYWKPSKSLTAIQRCNCPCHEGNGCNYFIWAQLPYKEGGAT